MEQCTTAFSLLRPDGCGATLRAKPSNAQAVPYWAAYTGARGALRASVSYSATASALRSSNSSCTAVWSSSGFCSDALCDTLTGTTQPWQAFGATGTSSPLAAPNKPAPFATALFKQLPPATFATSLASSKLLCPPSPAAVRVCRMVRTSATSLAASSASYAATAHATAAAAAKHLTLAVRSPPASPTASTSRYRYAALPVAPRRRCVLGYVGVDCEEAATPHQRQKQEHHDLAARLAGCSPSVEDGQRRNDENGAVRGVRTATWTLLEQDDADEYGTDVHSMAHVAAAHGYLLSPGTMYGSSSSSSTACAMYDDTFGAAPAAAAAVTEVIPRGSAGRWHGSLLTKASVSSSFGCRPRSGHDAATPCAAAAAATREPSTPAAADTNAARWTAHGGLAAASSAAAEEHTDDDEDVNSFLISAFFSKETLTVFSTLARSVHAPPLAAAASAEWASCLGATLPPHASLPPSPPAMPSEAPAAKEEVAAAAAAAAGFARSSSGPGAPGGGPWVLSSGVAGAHFEAVLVAEAVAEAEAERAAVGAASEAVASQAEAVAGSRVRALDSAGERPEEDVGAGEAAVAARMATRSTEVEECREMGGSGAAAADGRWRAGAAAAVAACAEAAAAAADGCEVIGAAGCVQGVVAAPAARPAVRGPRRVGAMVRAVFTGCLRRPE